MKHPDGAIQSREQLNSENNKKDKEMKNRASSLFFKFQ